MSSNTGCDGSLFPYKGMFQAQGTFQPLLKGQQTAPNCLSYLLPAVLAKLLNLAELFPHL